MLEIAIGGERRRFTLHVPPAIRDLPLRMPLDHPLNDRARAMRLGLMMAACVETVDDRPMSRELRLAIQRDPKALGALLAARSRLFEHYRNLGRCALYCPHCDTGELEVDLTGLAIALDAEPWPIAMADNTPADPFLTHLRLAAPRPTGLPTARLAIARLPSALAGLQSHVSSATFGPAIDTELDATGWKTWGRDGKPLQPNREHWSYGNPGFRTLLRLTLSLTELGGTGSLSPEQLEALPVVDILFLDALYMLLRTVPVIEPEPATLCCPVCQGKYLAIL
jgi:hypothetical protein